MKLRAYTPADRAACLALFDSNVPLFFAPPERPDFMSFLDAPSCAYYVVQDDDGAIIGCGGYHYDAAAPVASLCWGMVARDRHRSGVGTFLLRGRLRRLCADSGGRAVLWLNTSQHVAAFYQKFGFMIVRITPDGLAPGLDEIDMVLYLSEARCSELAETT
jgi:GNAT superfamily N-acetyltransferase